MTWFSYYSPLIFGALLTAVLAFNNRADLPQASAGVQTTLIILAALLFGVLCQLVMFGTQGAFAQVLPVPFGKSVRGRGAVVTGTLLILAVVFTLAAVLLAVEQFRTPGIVFMILSGAAWLGAALSYLWSLPAAIRDFAPEDWRRAE